MFRDPGRAAAVRAMQEMEWPYVDQAAEAQLRQRMENAAGVESIVTYGELVRDITFQMANVLGGVAFQIPRGTHGWSDLERAIVGSLLGRISAESYLHHGVFLSAVAVSTPQDGGGGNRPGGGFYDLARQMGLVAVDGEDLAFWTEHLNRAHDFHSARQNPRARTPWTP